MRILVSLKALHSCSYCRDKMLQAYEFALDKVGLDFNSYQASEMYCIKLTLPVVIKYF